ncbi:MAG: endonuclease/exonuclease/phosphatase family protein [Candidatus Tectomicrobia bacterium]|uniref:Endonuclease/exonuclease/phosphatase family protein n=1 Tax=Tectimicrobiota bacterium TaxID=2528274 RepID=A0A932I1S4_UNCTE|nr:endonuclease/exonuclease/phosphatase family protein [Candidatus Tectomicrobia bacterium]
MINRVYRPRAWFPPRGVMGWVAFLALVALILAALIDAGLWWFRINGRFGSKASFLSHFWPYFSLGGALVGLLARGVSNVLRSVPTIWLLASLAMQHASMLFPRGALPPLSGQMVRVMTLNLGPDESRRPAAYAYLRERRDIDVLFLQEVHGDERSGDRPRLAEALRGRYPHGAWREGPASTGRRFGLGILSRFPLREPEIIPLPPGPVPGGVCAEADALVARALAGERLLRLVNAHLCPPRVPWKDIWSRDVGLSFGSVLDWLTTLRLYEYARRAQLIHLRLIAEGGLDPFILAGTLNTTPKSLDVLRLAQRLRNAFEESGSGFGYTYYAGPFGAMVDHVYHSEGLLARGASVPDPGVSDHRPVEAALEILPPEPKARPRF